MPLTLNLKRSKETFMSKKKKNKRKNSKDFLLCGKDFSFPILPEKKDVILNAKSDTQVFIDQYVVWQDCSELMENEIVDITKKPYLLFGKFIHEGEMACIYSSPKVGKTYLSIHIANEAQPLKTIIFALDDAGVNQLGRYASVPTIKYITRKIFAEIGAKIKESVVKQCQTQAYYDHAMTKFDFLFDYKKIEERTQKLKKEYGIVDQQKIDNLISFEILAESFPCSEADIVIIDSLNGLLPNIWEINREYLDRITLPFRDRGQTLIVMHHTNKKGEIAGNSCLTQMFDTIIRLEKIGETNYRRISSESRFSKATEPCIVEMIFEDDQFVMFDVCEEPPLDAQTRFSLEDQILQAMEGIDVMYFNELFQAVKASNPGSVKNSLKKLARKGYISKGDGCTWSLIYNRM
jgi:KaiC/GvpD/RAD55 family RecA-like ATPase